MEQQQKSEAKRTRKANLMIDSIKDTYQMVKLQLTIERLSQASSVDDFILQKGQFLDDFKDAPTAQKENMTVDPPKSNPALASQHYALMAGMVEYLCNRNNLKKPDWIFDASYTLKSPFFAAGAVDELRVVYLLESPVELRARNYFTAANTFDRA